MRYTVYILIEQLKLFETINGIVELNYYGLSNYEKRKWSISFEKRLDNEDLYHYIEPCISSADIDKTNEVYSIFGSRKNKPTMKDR